MKLIYSRCGPTDLDQLTDIARDTFYQTFAKDNKPENINTYLDKAFSRATIEKELQNTGSEFYFALDNNELISYLKINRPGSQTDLNESGSLELERIYVLEEFQNRGYGKQLMDKTIEIARDQNSDYLWLGVWDQNQGAIRFYERNGFVKFDEHPFYMGEDLQTDYLMKLIL